MILPSLHGLAVVLVLSAAARLARTASLHFDSASKSKGKAASAAPGDGMDFASSLGMNEC
jgi:hypothetical protein